jgi:hypothetical protein
MGFTALGIQETLKVFTISQVLSRGRLHGAFGFDRV